MYMYGSGKLLYFLLNVMVNIGALASMIFVVISYLVMVLFPRMVQHKIVFVVNSILLSLAHIHKLIYYYGFWGAEVTQVMMMNLCRLTAVSINYRDGGVPKEKQDTELKSSKFLIIKL